jgi:hypothetical protein
MAAKEDAAGQSLLTFMDNVDPIKNDVYYGEDIIHSYPSGHFPTQAELEQLHADLREEVRPKGKDTTGSLLDLQPVKVTPKKPAPAKKKAKTKKTKQPIADILPNKKELLAELDAAIEKAPTKALARAAEVAGDGETGELRFDFGTDGEITVKNTKEDLEIVRKNVSSTAKTETLRLKLKAAPSKRGTTRPVTEIVKAIKDKIKAGKPAGTLRKDIADLQGVIPTDQYEKLNQAISIYDIVKESFSSMGRTADQNKRNAKKLTDIGVSKKAALKIVDGGYNKYHLNEDLTKILVSMSGAATKAPTENKIFTKEAKDKAVKRQKDKADY